MRTPSPSRPAGIRPLILAALSIALISALLTWHTLGAILPHARWAAALTSTGAMTSAEVLFVYSALPRLAMALVCGAGLALSGTIFQQVLRNPLAEPTTLGVSAGAQTGLLVALLWAPGLLGYGQAWPALLGAAIATVLVFTIARGGSSSPLTLIMAGLIVNLTLATVCAVLILFYPDQADDLSQWQTGRLEQNGWTQVCQLAPWLLAAFVLAVLLSRVLTVLEVGDHRARGLGLNLALLRPLILMIAIALAGAIVASVGIIGFVGLSVPAIAKLFGARRLIDRLVWSPVLGALLLWLADQIVQSVPIGGSQMPTGIFTALLGAPVLLLLLPRLRRSALATPPSQAPPRRLERPGLWLLAAAVLLAAMMVLSLGLGKDAAGWAWTGVADADFILRWRAPRVVAALSAGVLLGLSGTLMQRMTGNPMASPEVLGISSGAMLGAILLIFLVPGHGGILLVAAGATGAIATMTMIFTLGWRSGFTPERLVLAGVALGTIASAIAALMLARGGPERGVLLTWMSGSTYRVTAADAITVAVIAVASLPIALLFGRWLAILPFGGPQAQAVGVSVGMARGAIIAVAAVMTASATLIVGPSSFIGLLAPHLVRMMGFQRPATQLLAAAMAGGMIMLTADWIGRMILFPWQVPAGLLATVVGAPYFLALMRRNA